jgi:LemA protein
MHVNSRLILERFYQLPARKLRRGTFLGRFRTKTRALAQRYTVPMAIGTMFLGLWIFSHIYYYNILLGLRANCDTAMAQIEAAEEKREHVRRGLVQLLRFHAGYERDLMKDVTTLRGPSVRSEEGAAAGALAPKIDAVGEQYPNLVVNTTVNHASQAMIDAEIDVHKRVVDYNAAVNMYTSYLRQFPGNMFGRLMGFHDREYYKSRESLKFEEIAP